MEAGYEGSGIANSVRHVIRVNEENTERAVQAQIA